MHLDAQLQNYTDHLKQQGLLRARVLSDLDVPGGVLFDSNDYLSLTHHPELLKAYQKGYQCFPSGSGGSMVLSGYHANHQAVEQAFAQWLEVDACILFSSGYAANLAVTSLLGAVNASCLIDKGVHASIYDGIKLAQVTFKRYLHNSLEDAALQLTHSYYDVLITEGIFSMSGQVPRLAELSSLVSSSDMDLLIDEAHSFGIQGDEGRGAVSHHGLTQENVALRVIPLGKAFAGQGAIVAGRTRWIDGLLQAARSLIYSTAISPALSYGLLNTLELVAKADDRRSKLNTLVHYFRDCIKQSTFTWVDSQTHIQQLQLGCPHLALYYAHELKKQGIRCSAIRQPTVSLRYSGLRIILNYHHEPDHIDKLFKTLEIIHAHSPV